MAEGAAMHFELRLYEIDVYITGPFAYSFACSELPTSLTRSTVLISLPAHSLSRPRARGKEFYFYVVHFVDFSHSTLCVVVAVAGVVEAMFVTIIVAVMMKKIY